MCLSVQGKVIQIKKGGKSAEVDFGGVKKEINIELVRAGPGDYVMVHAGFAIKVLSEKEIRQNLSIIKSLGAQ